MNIEFCYTEEVNGVLSFLDENVMDRHRDGTPVTIGYLAGLGTSNVNNEPNYILHLYFKYVMGNVVDEPHCICNL